MTANLFKCASRCCEGRSFFPNQITEVEAGGVLLPLCPDCYKDLMAIAADRKLVGRLIVDSVSLGERQRIKVERAENYARSEVGFSINDKQEAHIDMNSATYIEVSAEVRYWEDATVNGIEDVDGSLIPLRDGKLWRPVIRLADGKIMNWPERTTADIHYKVCDQGEYWLLNDGGRRVCKWGGHYVPDKFLCHGDHGYGDYIIFNVGGDGMIRDWKKPETDKNSWVKLEEANA